MKQAVCCLMLLMAVLLAGCHSDIARLQFATSIVAEQVDYNTGSRIKPVYREGIIALMQQAGINPDKVRIRSDKSDFSGRTMELSAPLFDGLTPQQEDALRDALEGIIKAREDEFYLTLTLHPERIDADREHHDDVQTLATDYRVKLEIDKAVIGLSYSLGDMYAAALSGSREGKGEAFCSIAVNISPALPFTDVDVIYQPAEAAAQNTPNEAANREAASGEAEEMVNSNVPPVPQGMVLVRRPEGSHGAYKIPVDAVVTLAGTTPPLQKKLDNKEVLLSTAFINGDSVSLYRKDISALEFQLGSMGMISHRHRKVNYFAMQNLKEKCRAIAADSLGRPFSLSMGESIDRLESLTFL